MSRCGSGPRWPAGWACRRPSAWWSARSSWSTVFTGLTSGYVVLAVAAGRARASVRAAHPGLPAGGRRTAGRSPGGSWARRTGSAPGSTRTSPGPGSPGSWCRWPSRWAPCTCCTSSGTRSTTPGSSPARTASDGLLILIVIYTAGVVLTAIVGGMISDRLGRRKMIVTVSGTLIAAAALLLTFVETWPAVDRRGRAVRRRLRRLPGRRPGADHAGAARGRGPGQGPRRHQHRDRLPVRASGRCSPRRWSRWAVTRRCSPPLRSSRFLGSVLVWRIKSVP